MQQAAGPTRKQLRLARAVIEVAAERGVPEVRPLRNMPDEVLLAASDRAGYLTASSFEPPMHRPEARLPAIARALDAVEAAMAPRPPMVRPVDVEAEDEAELERRLRAEGFRDTAGMSPTDRRSTIDAMRAYSALKREQRFRVERQRASAARPGARDDRRADMPERVTRPAEYDREPKMEWRDVIPAGGQRAYTYKERASQAKRDQEQAAAEVAAAEVERERKALQDAEQAKRDRYAAQVCHEAALELYGAVGGHAQPVAPWARNAIRPTAEIRADEKRRTDAKAAEEHFAREAQRQRDLRDAEAAAQRRKEDATIAAWKQGTARPTVTLYFRAEHATCQYCRHERPRLRWDQTSWTHACAQYDVAG